MRHPFEDKLGTRRPLLVDDALGKRHPRRCPEDLDDDVGDEGYALIDHDHDEDDDGDDDDDDDCGLYEDEEG